MSPGPQRPVCLSGIVLRSSAAGAVVSSVDACCVPLFGPRSRFKCARSGLPSRPCAVRLARPDAACPIARIQAAVSGEYRTVGSRGPGMRTRLVGCRAPKVTAGGELPSPGADSATLHQRRAALPDAGMASVAWALLLGHASESDILSRNYYNCPSQRTVPGWWRYRCMWAQLDALHAVFLGGNNSVLGRICERLTCLSPGTRCKTLLVRTYFPVLYVGWRRYGRARSGYG